MKLHLDKVLILLIIAVFAPCGLYSQDRIFAYLVNDSGKQGTATVSQDYSVVEKIYEELVYARGDSRTLPPELVINDGNRFVAWMNPATGEIGIEKKALDFCLSMGPDSLNAIAALLSHELAHYYERHDGSSHFAALDGLDGEDQAREQLAIGMQQEKEADTQGGFLAYSAGYNIYDVLPRLMPALYDTYELPDTVPGYPSLERRVEMSQEAANELLKLQTVFETANLLVLIEEYEKANVYYRHLLRKFPSREMFNNAGICKVMNALDYYSISEMPYVFPFEPDPNSRLYNRKSGQDDRIAKRQRLLKLALREVNTAIQLDPAYGVAYLNKACIFTLQQSWKDAEYWLDKARAFHDVDPAQCLVVEAIQLAMQGKEKEALKLLDQPAMKNLALAKVNKRVIAKGKVYPKDNPTPEGTERIDSLNLRTYLDYLYPAPSAELSFGNGITCAKTELPHSNVYIHNAASGLEYILLQIGNEDCKDETYFGLKPGDDIADMYGYYGDPTRIISQGAGLCAVYKSFGLLVFLDERGKVERWGYYLKSK